MSPEPEALLHIDGLSVSYRQGAAGVGALRDVSLRVGHGEAVGLIGETGSGKSTLARAVLGLVAPSAGRVTVAGQELTAFGHRQWKEFRRRGLVQYVFQDPLRSLDPDLTVEDSISEPLQVRGGPAGALARPRVRELVAEQLRRMKLGTGLLGRHPGELSGGQRQRVAIARALITEPRLLILDEPVSALDAANRAQILELLAQLGHGGVSLLFISHDLGSVAGLTDRIAVLYRGSLVEVDGADAIVHRPRHPYTRLLVGSAPTLARGAISRERRQQLRAELSAPATASPDRPHDDHRGPLDRVRRQQIADHAAETVVRPGLATVGARLLREPHMVRRIAATAAAHIRRRPEPRA